MSTRDDVSGVLSLEVLGRGGGGGSTGRMR